MVITPSQKDQPINDIFRKEPIMEIDFFFFNQQKLGSG